MKEKDEVLKWACNLTDSIIAGTYNMPKEMTYCINMLQDAVYLYIGSEGKKLSETLSEDYVKFRDSERAKREERIRELYGSN